MDSTYPYVVLLSSLKLKRENISYYCGFDGHLISDIFGMFIAWIFYWSLIHVLYYFVGYIIRKLVKILYPENGTNFVPKKTQSLHIKLSEIAFPLYVFVPVFSDLFRKKGWAKTCSSISDCGGYIPSIINFGIFFVLLEFLVFFDHYYILHVWKWGKANLKHDLHHKFERADEMNTFTGFAFEALDGFSQGFPLALLQLVISVPYLWIIILSFIIGTWTMYIHCNQPSLCWPFMGADYHFIHHKYNWYNFGFFTMFFDYLFGTLKHPKKCDFET